MSSSIENFLQQFKSEKIVYIPDPGNAGDSVMAAATYQIFDRLGLNYTMPRYQKIKNSDLENSVVIYGGGGNLTGSLERFSSRVAHLVHERAKRFVILPHTIKSVTPLLEAFGPNVDIICRESVSYKYVSSTAPRANAYLMDDIAFSLDVSEVLEGKHILSPTVRLFSYAFSKTFLNTNIPVLEQVLRTFHLNKTKADFNDRLASEELYCFRTDGEKTDVTIPPSNIDLSEVFEFGVETKDVAYLSTREVLSFLSNFKTIHTNRLHMAISGALLGLDVRFYANNYYKCRAVFEQTMKDKYKNVQWMAQE